MTRKRGKVLCVDDSLVIQRLIDLRLRADFDVVSAGSASAGLAKAREAHPDVILLDIDMPEVNGYDACRHFKEQGDIKHIPIIFISAQAKTEDKVRGLELGAVDFVTKPFDPVELKARVNAAHRTKVLLELLEQRAQTDGLTTLYNRAYFNERLAEELDHCRNNGGNFVVIMLDVDKFKSVNDTFGHSIGDLVLVEVADVLRGQMRPTDLVARYGGEEFVILMPKTTLLEGALGADTFRKAVAEVRVECNGQRVPVSASFGVASLEHFADQPPKDIVDAADRCLYSAKQNGRNCAYAWNGTEPIAVHALE